MCDRRSGTYRGSTGRRRGSLAPSGHGGTEFRIRVIPRGFGKLGVTALVAVPVLFGLALVLVASRLCPEPRTTLIEQPARVRPSDPRA